MPEHDLPEYPTVRAAEGLLRGRRHGGHAVFRGIPYARPPVGALRFAAPAPVEPWHGVREAAEFGPTPPQSGPVAAAPTEGTDWLTLNVHTPDPGSAGLPVLVWIPGGGYIAAASDDPMYDATALASAGLVVVSLNYRAGVEGFALLDGVPANRALLDQIAALHWIRRNIAAFGGDPDQVTVAASPPEPGRSPPCSPWSRCAACSDVPSPTRCRAATAPPRWPPRSPPRWQAGSAPRPRPPPCRPSPPGTSPKRSPHSAPTCPDTAGAGGLRPVRRRGLPGRRRRGPARGALARPGLRPGRRHRPARRSHPGRVPAVHRHDRPAGHLHRTGRRHRARPLRPATGRPRRLPRRVPAGLPGRTAGGRPLRRAVPDALAPARRGQHRRRRHLVPVRAGPALPALGGALGACHSLDVPLAFGTLDSPIGRQLLGDTPSPEARAVSAELHRAWVAFATTGDPGWPAFQTEGQLTRVLDAHPRTIRYPEQDARRIWAGHHPAAFDLH